MQASVAHLTTSPSPANAKPIHHTQDTSHGVLLVLFGVPLSLGAAHHSRSAVHSLVSLEPRHVCRPGAVEAGLPYEREDSVLIMLQLLLSFKCTSIRPFIVLYINRASTCMVDISPIDIGLAPIWDIRQMVRCDDTALDQEKRSMSEHS